MLVVNLFAGPGAGKSTLAAGLLFRLKNVSIAAEIVPEVAKERVWDGDERIHNQLYILGEQLHRMERLEGEVAVAVCESPLLLSGVYAYDCEIPRIADAVRLIAEESHKRWQRVNFFIERRKRYSQPGRLQTESEARELDRRIQEYLLALGEPTEVLEGCDEKALDQLTRRVLVEPLHL